jgi:hypothetical protein
MLVTYPPALRRTGFGPPRAIRHFTDAIAEARAAEASPEPPPAPRPAAPTVVRHDRVVVRLWLPLTLLFVLLAPFALLLAPLLYFVPRLCPRPFATMFGIGRLLLSIGGTDVDVDTPEARIRIRIF